MLSKNHMNPWLASSECHFASGSAFDLSGGRASIDLLPRAAAEANGLKVYSAKNASAKINRQRRRSA
jgi:hypothetical protein